MIEFLVRFVVETIGPAFFRLLAHIGHTVVQEFVPRLTDQCVLVAPLRDSRVIVTRWHGVHQLTDGTPVIGEALAAAIGLTPPCVAIVMAVVMIFGRT